jgi:predicted RecA/RadA family phage recombinase
LIMKNYVQSGEIITVTAPADCKSGDPVAVGSIFGVACYDAANGTDLELNTDGVFDLPKVTTDVIGQGDRLYFDSTAGKLTKTAGTGSKPLVGFAVVAAGNGVTTVRCNVGWTGATGPA